MKYLYTYIFYTIILRWFWHGLPNHAQEKEICQTYGRRSRSGLGKLETRGKRGTGTRTCGQRGMLCIIGDDNILFFYFDGEKNELKTYI